MDDSQLVERTGRIGLQSLEDDRSSGAAMDRAVSFSLLALVEPFFANKRSLVLGVLGGMALSWVALLIWPRSYESEARLLIKVGRESVSLDPTATTSETMLLQKTQEEEVNSVLEVMGSRTLMGKVVEQLGTGPILDGYLSKQESDPSYLEKLVGLVKNSISDGVYHFLVAARLKDELSDRELSIMKLKDSIGIYARKKSTVVIVKASSRSPEMAQATAQAVVDNYLSVHLRTGRTEGSQEFFASQAAESEEQLNKLLDRRTEMLKERDIESIDSKRDALLSTLGNLETSVRGRLNDLELQEVELGSTVTERHPDFQRLRRELEETRQAVRAMQFEQNPEKDSQVRQASLSIPASRSIAKGGAKAKQLLNQKRRIQSELRELMDFQLRLDDVERSIGVTQDRLYNLRSKQEEARLIDELQARRISNLSVVQPASFVERAASPNKKILAAGFAGMGFMVGVGLIVLREMNSKTIRSTHQLGDLGQDTLVVDMPSRPGTFRRFHSNKGGRWRAPVMRRPLAEVLHEIVSMRQLSRDGLVVGVTGLTNGVGVTSIAAALAVHADAEGIETLLVSPGPTTGTDASVGSRPKAGDHSNERPNKENPAGQLLTDTRKSIDSHVSYLNNGSLKQLLPEDCVSYDLHEHREELRHWMRVENELTVVDLSRQAGRNSSLDVHLLDCVVVVAEAEKSSSVDLGRTLRRLDSRGVPVAAVVLNKTHRAIPKWIERLVS